MRSTSDCRRSPSVRSPRSSIPPGAPASGCRVGGQRAEIAVDQIRTVSKARLGRKVGALSNEEAGALRRLITEMYGE